MKISYNWLKDYVPLCETPERTAEILTSVGLEVEAMETHEAVRGGLRGVVVGEVLTCTPHPDADKLRITTVDVGTGEPLQIVCGAPNVAVGQKVPVAVVGTTLYGADGAEWKIKKSKLRGVESWGMICAEDELGLGTNHEGIMVLDAVIRPGTPLGEALSIEADTVFEIGLTPNRVDAASHTGVARDLAAYLNLPLHSPLKVAGSGYLRRGGGCGIAVRVENNDACPRYTGVTIRGVTVGPSPEWLQKRLTAIGVRTINNIVDITNYVLHETGQPLHAFDAGRIAGGEVIVKTCPEGTTFVTLDGTERILSAHDLMICNAREPMCIGGVFGGQAHGVTEATVDVFLESAYFNPVWIRKTARRHGLSTDASFRYERGADPQATPAALCRAAALIMEIAGGSVAGEIIDIYPAPVSPAVVSLHFDRIRRLIGKRIDRDTITGILQRLEFDIMDSTVDGLVVAVPTCRVDVTRECDVVEEILRIYGYNNVEIPAQTTLSIASGVHTPKETMQQTVSDYLVSNGFYEMMNNSLTRAEYYRSLLTFPESRAVRILNPLSSDLNVMRQTLLFGGLESIARNSHRQQSDVKLFEWGSCYAFNAGADGDPLKAYVETWQVALFTTGFVSPQHWRTPQERSDFFYLKGFVEGILRRFGIDIFRLETAAAPPDLFAEGIQYSRKGRVCAMVGTVSAAQRAAFDIRQPVYAAEISGDWLLKALRDVRVRYAELPKFPEVRRDLALVVDEAVTYAQLRDVAFGAERNLLQRVNLFDVYRGDKLPQGKKQYALSFVLQDKEKTLTDQHIEHIMDTLLKAFEQHFAATLR
ncbi:MAG: phenylalanine--tRNA ligase subunit beta [Prevotellaceae bacterium]|jgi:phenylalanyl-tRNA synthetase beta chain|nr:phenylalanine--tRNA ligase subunit beta [Prevotellaceae bacterium]